MQRTNLDQIEEQRSEEARGSDTYSVGEAMLARARSVAERITERCRQVAGADLEYADEPDRNQKSCPQV